MKSIEALTLFIDGMSKIAGWISALFIPALVLVTIMDVGLRYLFHAGSVAFQELEWHLYAANFVLAASWVMLKDGHVRVDIFYNYLTPRKRAVLDLLGILVFCIPFCLIVIWSSWPFFVNAWVIREGSPDPGGLPARYILKALIPVGFGLVLIQAASQALKCFFAIRGSKE